MPESVKEESKDPELKKREEAQKQAAKQRKHELINDIKSAFDFDIPVKKKKPVESFESILTEEKYSKK